MASILLMTKAGPLAYEVGAAGIVLGRGEDCDVPLDDARASRKHARVRAAEGGVEIADLGSRNGTFVDGARVAPERPVLVPWGATFVVGSTLGVAREGVAAAAPMRVHGEAALAPHVAQARGDHAVVDVVFDVAAMAPHATAGTSIAASFVRGAFAEHAMIELTLAESFAPADIVASTRPGAYRALLVDTPPTAARARVDALKERLAARGLSATCTADLRHRDEAPSAQADDGAMQRVAPVLERIAAGEINVLILGETGVGKEVMARTLHARSRRASAPFVAINCAAFSENLLEGELFGYEKGAFTGALQAKAGLLETANGGTLFLDELGEMPASLQAKLLRVLEQREVLRVGALKPRPIDVRFIAATNRDLRAEIGAGRFRQDLYYRLDGVAITIPPLRERRREIAPLARAFVERAARAAGRVVVPPIAPTVMDHFERYAWPGNIRELRNTIERALVLSEGDEITIDCMRPVVAFSEPSASPTEHPAPPPGAGGDADNADDLRARIIHALDVCAGNQTRAAAMLGMPRRTFVTRLEELDVPRPRKR